MILPPRYVDLQVNGYAGVDFNQDDLPAADLHRACELLREDGVAGILATIITDTIPKMAARLARIAAVCEQDALVRKTVWGIHIEGPFLNASPGYVGAHSPDAVCPGDVEVMKRLLEAAGDLTRLVTLAPECDRGMQVTRYLARHEVLVAAGHCDASYDELSAAIDAGLSMFTHLGNGCPMMLPRNDNIIQRVLGLRKRLTISFIADGIHVPPVALANYLHLAGIERSIVVTDAISAARLGPGNYSLGRQEIEIGEDLVAHAPNSPMLMGSTATMPQMAAVLRDEIGLSEDEIRQLVWDNPRRVLAQVAGLPADGAAVEK
jgi:N-acetylglucosamine-6-phosphate deacetylase